jgi:hydrogenase maturation protease
MRSFVADAPILVIGFGNPLRGDDGVGWRVAQALEAMALPEQVTIITCQQLTPELAEPVSQASLVILIDAARGGIPGTIDCQLVPLETQPPPTLGHHVEPGALLAYAQALYGSAPPLWLWTIMGEAFESGDSLSPPVEAAVPALAHVLCDSIHEL